MSEPVGLALDLMIAGAAKSGTTSLYDILETAPGVAGIDRPGELTYYLEDREFARGPQVARQRYFPGTREPGALRLGKSAGLMYSEVALQRLHDDSPDVRVIIVVRNPVDRAYSAYLWAQRAGMETDTFADAIKRELAGRDLDLPRPELRHYVARGEYARAIRNTHAIFGEAKVRVLTMDDLRGDPYAAANAVLAGLPTNVEPASASATHSNQRSGVRSARLARLVRSQRLRSSLRHVLPDRLRARLMQTALQLNEKPATTEAMDEPTKALLREHFRAWNVELEQLLQRPLGWD